MGNDWILILAVIFCPVLGALLCLLDRRLCRWVNREDEHQGKKNRCISCGAVIPDGWDVCWRCEKGGNEE